MEQRDYLKRVIDQIGLVLGKITVALLGLRKGELATEGIPAVSTTLQDELDVDMDRLLEADEEAFIHLLVEEKGFGVPHLEALFDILLKVADDMPVTALNRCLLYERCLFLCTYLDAVSHTISFDRHLKSGRIAVGLH